MIYKDLEKYFNIKSIDLINLRTNVNTKDKKSLNNSTLNVNIGLTNRPIKNEYDELEVDIAIDIKVKENKEIPDMDIGMLFIYRITLGMGQLVNNKLELKDIDEENLVKLCINYLYPSLNELVNILCYKMNIDPFNIPNPLIEG